MILVPQLSCVYAQDLMRPKLLIAVLALTLSGTNCDLAWMCAAYCMSPASVHHHMGSQPSTVAISHQMHADHQGAECAECPPKSANSLNEKADCASFAEIQALKEASFSLDAARVVARVQVVDMLARALASASDGERFSPVNAPNKIRSFDPVSAPLRI